MDTGSVGKDDLCIFSVIDRLDVGSCSLRLMGYDGDLHACDVVKKR